MTACGADLVDAPITGTAIILESVRTGGGGHLSLDVIVQDIPSEAASPREIPDGFQPQGLGLTGTDVLNAARAVGGSLNASDPTSVHWTGPGYEIELNLDDPDRSFALHCRGDADACRAAAAALVERLGVRAFVVWDGTIIG